MNDPVRLEMPVLTFGHLETEYLLENLPPGTKYTFKIAAIYTKGFGCYSKTISLLPVSYGKENVW